MNVDNTLLMWRQSASWRRSAGVGPLASVRWRESCLQQRTSGGQRCSDVLPERLSFTESRDCLWAVDGCDVWSAEFAASRCRGSPPDVRL